jgi:hypothetical protein
MMYKDKNMTCVGCNKACQPRFGLSTCDGCFQQCPQHASVPVIMFPDQSAQAAAALSQGALAHDQIITIVSGTYYEFNGAFLVHVGSQDYLEYSANPILPVSSLFQFRFRKYPALGNDVRADGTVPYQSAGPVIREGDFVMLESVGVGMNLTQFGYPSPYNAPFMGTTSRDAILNFSSFGTQSFENLRIISDTYDPAVAPDQQPPVANDGSKAYYIQFTRTAQNLAFYPGKSPAPCRLITSAYKGNGTRWVFLPPSFYQ